MKTLKCTVVGDPGVGKASLLKTYVTGEFPENCEPIIFDTFLTAPTVDGKDYQLSLWYTNGMEEFNRFRPLSYPGSNVILICFSLEFRTSFDNVLDKWINEIKEYCPNIPILLVGLKQDLRNNFHHNRNAIKNNNKYLHEDDDDNNRCDIILEKLEIKQAEADGLISNEEGIQMATKINAVKYIEVSSLTKFNLFVLFEEAVRNSAPTPVNETLDEEKGSFATCKGCVIT